MTDSALIDLYWQRSEQAIAETDRAYGSYCYAVAYHVLANREDSDESVNDTWLAAWNAMPPARPSSLKAYLGRLTRNIAISRLRRSSSQKRGGGEITLAMDELGDCIPSSFDMNRTLEARELAESIDRFLAALPERERVIFTARYWYLLPVDEIARRLDMKPNTVKTSLYRSRARLLAHLKKEGL